MPININCFFLNTVIYNFFEGLARGRFGIEIALVKRSSIFLVKFDDWAHLDILKNPFEANWKIQLMLFPLHNLV